MTAIGRAPDVAAAPARARRAVDGPRAADRRRTSSRRCSKLNRRSGLSILVAEQNSAVALDYADRADGARERRRRVLSGPAAELGSATTSRPSISASAAAPRPRNCRSRQSPERQLGSNRIRHDLSNAKHRRGFRRSAAGRPTRPARAHVIRSDAEAIAIARSARRRLRQGCLGARPRRGSGRWRSSMPSRRAACGRSTCPRRSAAPSCPTSRWPG